MSQDIALPRLGETMEEGKLVAWLVAPGEAVTRGQVIAEVETDKTVVELPALTTGTVEALLVEVGATVAVGETIARLSGESSAAARTPKKKKAKTKTPRTTPTEQPADKLRASPAARRAAARSGIDLAKVKGSGPRGRIQARDVRTRDAGTLAITRLGQGTALPLVLLHGFGGDAATWAGLMPQLALDRPLLVPDLPGHGGSLEVAGASLGELAETLAAALPREAHLVGHSLGGALAASLALGGAVRPVSMTLIAPGGFGPEINHRLLARFAESLSPAETLVTLEQFFGWSRPIPPGIAEAVSKARRAPGAPQRLQAILAEMCDGEGRQKRIDRMALDDLGCPVKVIWGTQDRVLPTRQSHRLPGAVAGHVFEEVGHMPHLEVPEAVLRLIREAVAAGEGLVR